MFSRKPHEMEISFDNDVETPGRALAGGDGLKWEALCLAQARECGHFSSNDSFRPNILEEKTGRECTCFATGNFDAT
jgi:hypothetical protein